MKRAILTLIVLVLMLTIKAQNTPTVNGLNEAQIIYRDTPDSLKIYFKDSFAFQLGYKGFNFGMKYIAELPKYSTNQSDLIGNLNSYHLSQGFKELHLSFERGPWIVKAGTQQETFGSGLVFRSYEDQEFDLDHRLDGFSFKYDDRFRIKGIYGANASPVNDKALDLAYGLDFQYPLFKYASLGASAVGFRNLTPFNNYSQSEIYATRLGLNHNWFNFQGEYAIRKLHDRGCETLAPIEGSALYLNADVNFGPATVGAALKKYDHFNFRQQDIPLANYHGETLSDNQASALDEIGAQIWGIFAVDDGLSLEMNYAEAWNKDYSKSLSDAYVAVEFETENIDGGVSWSHVEKTGSDPNHLEQDIHYWQREATPAAHLDFYILGRAVNTSAELKIISKQLYDAPSNSYPQHDYLEPKFQADFAFGAHSLALGLQSRWEDFANIAQNRYWANAEARIALFDHSDLLIFAGREAGGKVCRNGMCRYVAPFSGLRVELSTRF